MKSLEVTTMESQNKGYGKLIYDNYNDENIRYSKTVSFIIALFYATMNTLILCIVIYLTIDESFGFYVFLIGTIIASILNGYIGLSWSLPPYFKITLQKIFHKIRRHKQNPSA